MVLLCGFGALAQKTDIVVLGSDHLAAVYKPAMEHTDVLSEKAQKSLAGFNEKVARYKPDCIMVEEMPEKQREIDSLYTLFREDKLALTNLGRSEIYQIAFPIGKKLKISRIYCVNARGGTSQSLLDNGTNIEVYKNETVELRKIVSDKYARIQSGALSFSDYITSLNQPELYNKVYHLRYITPSRVRNGSFKNPEKEIDTTKIDGRYIGAELTSIWKNRDYKIYSNIVSLSLENKPKRMLLLIGVAHIGSLKSIFRDDSAFHFIEAATILK